MLDLLWQTQLNGFYVEERSEKQLEKRLSNKADDLQWKLKISDAFRQPMCV